VRTIVLCPFNAGTVLWQPHEGAWSLTVVVRGTFSLVNGREAVLADVQEPLGGDRYYDDNPRAALYAPSDLVPYKGRSDILLVGRAYAPDKQPVDALIARMSVAGLDKAIGVIGDRTWIEGPDALEPGAPTPFVSMPLRAERAARSPDNPVGFDLTHTPRAGALAIPNLEPIDDDPLDGRSVGFGPISPRASTRRSLLRPEAWAWVEGGYRGPAPAGFDFAFFNAAPLDQQVKLLRQGEAIVLENLHHEYPRLETRIPFVRPKAFLTTEALQQASEIALRCDTLWIDTERALMTLTWRGLTELRASDAIDTVVIGAEPRGRELRFSHVQKLLCDNVSVSLSLADDTLSDTNTGAPQIWEELSSSELLDATMTEEPTGLDSARNKTKKTR